MSDFELTLVSVDSFPAPALITRASPSTRQKFFEFFTVPIRNGKPTAAYYRAIQQFLAWAERAGYQDLEDIEPITVAAYIETLQRQAAPPTVKQHMAALRMLFSWLTEKGVLAMNPAREVKTERFSRTEGKTPAFVEGEVQHPNPFCCVYGPMSASGRRKFLERLQSWPERVRVKALAA